MMNRFFLGLLTVCTVFGNDAFAVNNENNSNISYCFFLEPNTNFDESLINGSITIHFDFFCGFSNTIYSGIRFEHSDALSIYYLHDDSSSELVYDATFDTDYLFFWKNNEFRFITIQSYDELELDTFSQIINGFAYCDHYSKINSFYTFNTLPFKNLRSHDISFYDYLPFTCNNVNYSNLAIFFKDNNPVILYENDSINILNEVYTTDDINSNSHWINEQYRFIQFQDVLMSDAYKKVLDEMGVWSNTDTSHKKITNIYIIIGCGVATILLVFLLLKIAKKH